uniref:Zinc finger protein 227 n=1 Tax=Saimiri boliviensis boliviensis TaxID=39432 RepID=A0A2K6TVJ2_SAIBB
MVENFKNLVAVGEDRRSLTLNLNSLENLCARQQASK